MQVCDIACDRKLIDECRLFTLYEYEPQIDYAFDDEVINNDHNLYLHSTAGKLTSVKLAVCVQCAHEQWDNRNGTTADSVLENRRKRNTQWTSTSTSVVVYTQYSIHNNNNTIITNLFRSTRNKMWLQKKNLQPNTVNDIYILYICVYTCARNSVVSTRNIHEHESIPK